MLHAGEEIVSAPTGDYERGRETYPIVEEPAHVGPPEPFIWGVRIKGSIGVQVVVAVGGHPLNGLPLHCKHTAVGQCVLQPLGCREAAVAQLSVEAQCYSQAACAAICQS